MPSIDPVGRAIGQRLRGIGASVVGARPAAKKEPGFVAGAKVGLEEAGKSWQRFGAWAGIIPRAEAEAAGAYSAPTAAPEGSGFGYKAGSFLGQAVGPADVLAGGAAGLAAAPLAGLVRRQVLARVGQGLGGRITGYAARGATIGAPAGAATVAAQQRIDERPFDLGEIGLGAGMGAVGGAVLDPAIMGGIDLTGRVARGTRAMFDVPADIQPAPLHANLGLPYEELIRLGKLRARRGKTQVEIEAGEPNKGPYARLTTMQRGGRKGLVVTMPMVDPAADPLALGGPVELNHLFIGIAEEAKKLGATHVMTMAADADPKVIRWLARRGAKVEPGPDQQAWVVANARDVIKGSRRKNARNVQRVMEELGFVKDPESAKYLDPNDPNNYDAGDDDWDPPEPEPEPDVPSDRYGDSNLRKLPGDVEGISTSGEIPGISDQPGFKAGDDFEVPPSWEDAVNETIQDGPQNQSSVDELRASRDALSRQMDRLVEKFGDDPDTWPTEAGDLFVRWSGAIDRINNEILKHMGLPGYDKMGDVLRPRQEIPPPPKVQKEIAEGDLTDQLRRSLFNQQTPGNRLPREVRMSGNFPEPELGEFDRLTLEGMTPSSERGGPLPGTPEYVGPIREGPVDARSIKDLRPVNPPRAIDPHRLNAGLPLDQLKELGRRFVRGFRGDDPSPYQPRRAEDEAARALSSKASPGSGVTPEVAAVWQLKDPDALAAYYLAVAGRRMGTKGGVKQMDAVAKLARRMMLSHGAEVQRVSMSGHLDARSDIKVALDEHGGWHQLTNDALRKTNLGANAPSPDAMTAYSGLPLDKMAEQGAKLIDEGKSAFRLWRSEMEKAGHAFKSEYAARKVHRQSKEFLGKLYKDPVLNVRKFHLDPTGKLALRDAVEKFRGVKKGLEEPLEERRRAMLEMADKIGIDHKALNIDAAKRLSGVEIAAREHLIQQRMREVEKHWKILADPDAPSETKMESFEFVQGVENQLDGLLSDVVIGASQKGRDLQSLRLAAKHSLDPKVWRVRAKKALGFKVDKDGKVDEGKPYTLDLDTELNRLLEAAKKAAPGADRDRALSAVASFVHGLEDETKLSQVVKLFKTLITPPGTLDVSNITSNTTMHGLELASHGYAALWDMLFQLAGGGKRSVISPIGFGSGQAYKAGATYGKERALDILKHGVDPRRGGKFASGESPITLTPNARANAIISTYVKYHWRRFGAADAVFQEEKIAQMLNHEARLKAHNEGHTGEGFEKRVTEILSDPTLHPEMAVRAIEAAEYVTFTGDNRLAEGIIVGRSKFSEGGSAAVHVGVPFVKTLANIANVVIDYTPFVGLAREAFKQVGKGAFQRRAFVEALGRQSTAGSMMVLAYYMAQEGLLTGTGAENTAEREHEQAMGKQPFSIKVGDNWRSYERLVGPAAPIIAVGADLFALGERLRKPEAGRSAWDKAKRTVLRGYVGSLVESAPGGNLTVFGRSQSADPEGSFGKRAFGNVVVPNIGGIQQIARGMDPYERSPKSFEDFVKSRIPGLRETLPVKRTSTGEPVQKGGGGILREFLDPTRPTRANPSPVLKEMERLGVKLTMPSPIDTYSRAQQAARRRRGETSSRIPERYERSQADRSELAARAGPRIMERLDKLMARPGYARLPDERKRRLILEIMNAEKQRQDRRYSHEQLRQGIIPPPLPE